MVKVRSLRSLSVGYGRGDLARTRFSSNKTLCKGWVTQPLRLTTIPQRRLIRIVTITIAIIRSINAPNSKVVTDICV